MWALLKANWVWIKFVLIGLGLLLFLVFVVTQIQSCNSNKAIEGDKANINAEISNAQNVNAEIATIKQEDVAKNAQIKEQVKQHEVIKHERENSQAVTNQSLGNAAVIRNTNISNVSANEAERLRCIAYPNDPGCN